MAAARRLLLRWPWSSPSCSCRTSPQMQQQQQIMTRFSLARTAFGIAFDIDGVFIRGSEVIGRAPEAVQRLYKDVEKGELLVPFVFLTNGGGTTEAVRAEVLSRQLSVPIDPLQVNLGHTPFRALAKRFRAKRVLAVGKGEPETALKSYGFTTVVRMDKFCEEFEYIDPLQSYKPWVKQYDAAARDMLTPPEERQIAAVFVCSDPVDWSRDLQVLCDVLRSGGQPGKRGSELPQPPLYLAADDFEFPTKFPVPRFGMGAFRLALQALFSRLMRRPLACTSFGKPKPVVYHMAANSLRNVAASMMATTATSGGKREAFETLYMIGDNPETDVAGAIRAGKPWFSILVRTGNFKGSGNHEVFPADKVVDDVYAAVDFILKREGVS